MANPYLINAMFGQKPEASPKKEEDNWGDSAQPQPPTASNSPSLFEKLYGSKSAERERSNQCRSSMSSKTSTFMPAATSFSLPSLKGQEENSQKGSNLIICRERSQTTNNGSSPLNPFERTAEDQAQFFKRVLQHPVERHLPPPGLYFDQFYLIKVFGSNNLACWYCWNSRQVCAKCGHCSIPCKLCNETKHSGNICPLLYCTTEWFKCRKASSARNQLRPNKIEFSILCKRGLFLGGDYALPLVPDPSNSTVKQFYKGKEFPKLYSEKLALGNVGKLSNVDRNVLIKTGPPTTPSTILTLPQLVSRTENALVQVTGQNLNTNEKTADPGSHSDTIVAIPTGEQESRSTPKLVLTQPHPAPVYDELELKIRELEVEVHKLRWNNIEKDREIRRLRSEVQRLQGNAFAPGSKRPCL